jgi:hypothetical protein
MPPPQPLLITWLQTQVQEDIDLMSAILKHEMPEPPRWARFALGVVARYAPLTRRQIRMNTHLQEEAECRLPNRRLLLAEIAQHPHDELGCRVCHFPADLNRRLPYDSSCCPTVVLAAAMYRARPGYLSEWRTWVDQLMGGPGWDIS